MAAEGSSGAVQENERLVQLIAGPALAAEAASTEELRARRYGPQRDVGRPFSR